MNRISVKHIAASAVPAENVRALFCEENVPEHSVGIANWDSEFPYRPQTQVSIAYTDQAILVLYKVKENCIRAVTPHDNGHVWEDSCCEFFVQPADDDTYYNIECNCAGTLLVGFGKDRYKRELAPKSVLEQVRRWSSLGRTPFDSLNGNFEWELALAIPFTTFFKHTVCSLGGKVMKANFYKCGDKTTTPHFLSWCPIKVPHPDFHCPDYFGELAF
ncbi:MAG: carbohydrate-binding family 9-like protein [Prevotella sp.]|nr:carbohydrate-binding family 9-like protein [Prevotella sp.]